MKTPTPAVAFLIAGIGIVTAAVFAAAPQAPKREPSVLTLKSNGKPVAVLTLEVLDDAPVVITSEGRSLLEGSEDRGGKATFSGGVTVRSRRAGEKAAFEIKADEVEMQWKVQQPAPKREPSVLTLKSNGKPIAALTLEVLDDGPLEITSEGGMSHFERSGKMTFSGGVTVRSRPAGERTAFEINAEEFEMRMDKPKLK